MADRGITFSAAMVRAMLEGRKTQTRRLLSPQPVWEPEMVHGFTFAAGWAVEKLGMSRWRDSDEFREHLLSLVRHQPGDRLYVREHWKVDAEYDPFAPSELPELGFFDGVVCYLATAPAESLRDPVWGRHRQAMHMPRWASRLTLLVTDVRVQRLQDISEEDAIAEGIVWQDPTAEDFEWAKAHEAEYGEPCEMQGVWIAPGTDCGFGPKPRQPLWGCTAKQAYGFLWDSLHTDPGTRWEDNPWITAISFSVKHGNIDQ